MNKMFALLFFLAAQAHAFKIQIQRDVVEDVRSISAVITERKKFAQLEADAAKRKGTSSPEYIAAAEKLRKIEEIESKTAQALKDTEKAQEGTYTYGDSDPKKWKVSDLANALETEFMTRNVNYDALIGHADPEKLASLDRSREQAAKEMIERSKIVGVSPQRLLDVAQARRDLFETVDSLIKNADPDLGLGTIGDTTTMWYSPYSTTTVRGKALDKSATILSFEKKYALLDWNKAAGNLSADAVDLILREKDASSQRSADDKKAIENALYAGESYVDRQNNRVRLSNIVLRPGSSSVNRVFITDRRDGDYLGMSIVSLLQTFNTTVGDDWGTKLDLSKQPLVNGLPSHYRVFEQLSLRSPDACQLCISQTFSVPTQVNGEWQQAHTEQFGVQGTDVGFQRFDAAGTLLSGSDTITITKDVSDNQFIKLSYFNTTLNQAMFDVKVYLVDQKTSPGSSNAGPLLGSSLRTLTGVPVGTTDRLVELNFSSGAFSGASKQIDVLVTGDQFLSLF